MDEVKDWGVQGKGGWVREQRDLRRKVPRPSVGICLNSQGKPTHPPTRPPLFLGGPAGQGVCALM